MDANRGAIAVCFPIWSREPKALGWAQENTKSHTKTLEITQLKTNHLFKYQSDRQISHKPVLYTSAELESFHSSMFSKPQFLASTLLNTRLKAKHEVYRAQPLVLHLLIHSFRKLIPTLSILFAQIGCFIGKPHILPVWPGYQKPSKLEKCWMHIHLLLLINFF